MSEHDDVKALFAKHGFTFAGGMWGDAQWKKLSDDLIVSVGQEYVWEADEKIPDDQIEALAAPDVFSRRCAIYVYHAPFLDPDWDVSWGEAPCEEALVRLIVRDVYAAIEYCNTI